MPQDGEGRKFEPPPWEKEQFEELARRRATEQADQEIDSAVQRLENSQAVAPIVAPAPEPEAPKETPQSGGTGSPVSEADMIEMLSKLAIEEPRAIEELWRIGLFGAVVTGAIGLMMIVLGVVGMARTARSGPTGLMGGFVLLGFGAGFIGISIWTAVRTLKQRGVL